MKTAKSPLSERAGQVVRPANERLASRPFPPRSARSVWDAALQPACGGSGRLASGPQGRKQPDRFSLQVSQRCAFHLPSRGGSGCACKRTPAFVVSQGQKARAGEPPPPVGVAKDRKSANRWHRRVGLRAPRHRQVDRRPFKIGPSSKTAHDRMASLSVPVPSRDDRFRNVRTAVPQISARYILEKVGGGPRRKRGATLKPGAWKVGARLTLASGTQDQALGFVGQFAFGEVCE